MPKKKQAEGASKASGRFAYDGLERVIHEKARLGLLASLVTRPQGLAFNDLKELCGLTDGNLARHLAVLEEESLVEVIKGRSEGRSQTICRLTKTGRERFREYLLELQRVVADAVAAKVVEERRFEGLSPNKLLGFST